MTKYAKYTKIYLEMLAKYARQILWRTKENPEYFVQSAARHDAYENDRTAAHGGVRRRVVRRRTHYYPPMSPHRL